MPRTKTVYFADGVYGGHEPAYEAAVAYRMKQAPITDQGRPLRKKELESKQKKTGEPGIFFSHKFSQNRRRGSKRYYFRIVAPGLLKTLYIGTENTWHNNYDQRLAQAIAIRKSWIQGMLAS